MSNGICEYFHNIVTIIIVILRVYYRLLNMSPMNGYTIKDFFLICISKLYEI